MIYLKRLSQEINERVNFEMSLIDIYAHLLRFLIEVINMCGKSDISRVIDEAL